MSPRRPKGVAVTRVTEPDPVQITAASEQPEMSVGDIEAILGETHDEMEERVAVAWGMAKQASKLFKPGSKTFYVVECLSCHEVCHLRCGANGIKGASTWARKRCPSCNAKFNLKAVKVHGGLPGASPWIQKGDEDGDE